MKIALVTTHVVPNYGAVLQAYATKKIFEKHNCEVEVIDYFSERYCFRKKYWDSSAGSFLLKRVLRIPHVYAVNHLFRKFTKKNLKLTKKYPLYKDILEDPPEADMYVTGSDQCWNTFYNGIDKVFYLRFGDKNKKRISFSTSVGNEKFDPKEENEISEYLSDYSMISVRERSSVPVIQRLTDTPVIDIIDPTLQLNAEEWNRIASKRIIKDKYLLLFILYDEDLNATKYAKMIAKEKGLKLIELTLNFKSSKDVDMQLRYKSPAEFLALFRDAEYIVTNSFHGAAFSVNFNKQFTVIRRSQFNNRIENLLRITGLEEREVSDKLDMAVVNKKIEYEEVNRRLEKERQRANRFIEKALSEVNHEE